MEDSKKREKTPIADWSQLPIELLQLISNRLNSDFYILRFRSVCSNWRSSTPIPNPNPNPNHLNLLYKSVYLSKRSLFLIFPPHPRPSYYTPWLIKIDNSDNQLLSPLSRDSPLPRFFPPVLDFNDLSVVELGHEFVLCSEFSDDDEKVVLFQIEQRFVLLKIHVSGKLAVFRLGDNRWTIIREMSREYDDVCVFKGKPIAVDNTGRVVRVRVGVGIEPELGLELVAEPIRFGRDKKYLVESNGELLLVDKQYSRVKYGHNYGVKWIVKFVVYRLDEREKRWVELTSLGDRSLFLGDDCAFSLSASDLGSSGCWNYVIFRDDAFFRFELESAEFELGRRKSTPLGKTGIDFFYDLFMGPDWVRQRRQLFLGESRAPRT